MIIRSISGVRGTAPEFTSESIFRYAQAFNALQPKGVFMLGRDTRPSGEGFIEDVAQALISVGRDVINLNIGRKYRCSRRDCCYSQPQSD